MKISLRLFGFSLALFALAFANRVETYAQHDGLFDGAYQPVMAGELPSLIPGRLWIAANIADRGLGYQGSYVTLGTKTHLFQDFLDGRWLFEGRGHISAESGGLFANLGIERVFSLPSAGAEVSSSFWFDYDNDQQGDFAHTMTAVGVSAAIKTQRWDLYGNGYIPVGTSDFPQGDPNGAECFLGHSIVLQAAIDSALTGFDAMLRYRPEGIAHINGSFEIGAYSYNSALVDEFSGVRVRSGAQFMRGLIVSGEVNHDDRFNFTGVLSVSLMFGGNARGTEYGLLGRDLEPTVRNDHIVRFQQDLILAIDPDTGLPYNVFHVDNTADPGFATGTVETPFTSLADAEAASSTDDIIFVRPGDGTTRNMDEGIVLKDGQLFLGSGVQHLIPVQNGEFFVLCNPIDGNRPRITNTLGGPAVTLASRNTVRGFFIDGAEPGAFISNGIQASSGSTQRNGIIEDVTILSPVLNGISLNDIAGDWRFARNTILDAGFDGIFIDNAIDPTSRFDFIENNVSFNNRDGIHIEDYDGRIFNFDSNITSNNLRHGIRMERYVGTRGIFEFLSPVANNNLGDGISIVDADGNLRILNASINANGANGVHLVNFTNTDPRDGTFIGTFNGGTSNITNNGFGGGANVNIELLGGVQRVLITDSNLNGGGMGIMARATNVGTLLDIDVIDNISVSGNNADGMRFISETSATMNVFVANTGAALNVEGNGGNGMSFLVGDDAGGALSSLNAVVRNVNIAGSGAHGIFGASIDDGQLTLDLANMTIQGSGADGIHINVETNPTLAVNFLRVNNVAITGSGDDGIDINTGPDSFFDFVLTNSTLSNGPAAGGGTTGGNGVEITAIGGAGAPTDDNRTRILMRGNTIQGFANNGVTVNTFGDARVLATLDANTIQNNGEGVDPGELPYFHGVQVIAAGDSSVNIALTSNNINGNFEQGVSMSTLGSGSINAVLIGNSIVNNDVGEDDPAPITSNIADMIITNAPLGTISLAMSNNFFVLPAFVINGGGAVSFVLELDGITNGVGVPITIGAFTFSPYSVITIPAFNAETAAFEAAGFPPQ